MRNIKLIILTLSTILLLATFCNPVNAQKFTAPDQTSIAPGATTAPAYDAVPAAIYSAINANVSGLTSMATKWLSAFIMIQFVLTQIGMLKSGADLEAIMGKVIGSLLWFSFCFYCISAGPGFIQNTGNYLLSQVAGWTGSNLTDTGSIVGNGLKAVYALYNATMQVSLNPAILLLLAIAAVPCSLIMILITVYIAFKVFMIQLELTLVVMMSPLSFSFLGLNALKDQGIAPFKSLISLTYRIILLAVIVSAMNGVITGIQTLASTISGAGSFSQQVINSFTGNGTGDMLLAFFMATCAFVFLAFITHKSDSIAASLASGSTSMGPSDIGAAVAAGVAAGAVVAATGGAGAAGAAGSGGGKSMGDVMSSMGGGGSISNAGGSGSGKPGGGDAPKPPASSLGNGSTRPTPPEISSASGDGSGGPTPSSPETDSGSAGNGSSAGIGGGNSGGGDLAKQIGNLVDTLTQQNQPTLGDRLNTAHQHLEKEKAATSVSISTHNSHE
jgi:type IV secretion system protein TrbL